MAAHCEHLMEVPCEVLMGYRGSIRIIEKTMETIEIIGVILGLYRDNGKWKLL